MHASPPNSSMFQYLPKYRSLDAIFQQSKQLSWSWGRILPIPSHDLSSSVNSMVGFRFVIGLPPVIIHSKMGFSLINQAFLDTPHDYGKLHVDLDPVTKNLADSVQASSMWPLSGSSNPNSWKKIPPDYLVGHPTNAKWLSSPQLEVDLPYPTY